MTVRTLVVAAISVPLGLFLWYLASVGLFIAIEVPDLGLSRSEYVTGGVKNAPGLLYSSLFMVIWATQEYGVIGVPICLAGAVVVALLLTSAGVASIGTKVR